MDKTADADIVNLAAMECAASCLVTGLRRAGLNEQLLLLGYWSLVYRNRILLAGRNIRLLDLDYLYGIRQSFRQGDEQSAAAVLREGGMALLQCRASRLDYFPKELVTFEEDGFQHYILLTAWNERAGAMAVVDPVADFRGELPLGRLYAAGPLPDKLVYYALTPPPVRFAPPSAADMFAKEARANLGYYADSGVQGGMRAIDLFLGDLADSLGWDDGRRSAWAYRNNVTITAIVKLRRLVWYAFRGLGVMNAEREAAGEAMVEAIAKMWTGLNFLLVKYQRNGSPALAAAAAERTRAVARAEAEFLAFLDETGGGLRGL